MTGRPLNGQPRAHIQPTLMAHFEKHPGKTIDVDELCRLTGASRLQVQKSMGGVKSKPLWSTALEVVVTGNAWRYATRPGEFSGFSAPHPDASADRHGYAPDESQASVYADALDLPKTIMGREGFAAARQKREAAEEAEVGVAVFRLIGNASNGDLILERAGRAKGLYRATPL